MNGKYFRLIVFTVCFSFRLYAQQFGAFPPSTKWRQIKSDTARIIYEPAVDSQAQNIAAIIHKMNRYNPTALGNKIRQVNVVLHKNTTLANGYVALGPFRSEYYLVPGSNLFEFGNTPWHQTLAVHEYRHVHQYANFNKGVSKVGSVLFGQEGQALFNAISIPDWFFEGDAVHAETIETTQGRGRAPNFYNGFKALWHEQRQYSWMKLRNGSLKDFVPNHYPLGYLLVNYGYLKHGADFWKNVTQDALSFRGFFGFFGGSIRKYSGQSFKNFREEALAFYSHEVSTRRDGKRARATVTDYLFPQQIGTDSILYVKTSYKKLPTFYIQDKEGEHRLKLRSITNEDWLSCRNGMIAYTAYNTHPRWNLLNYSNIILMDVKTGKEKRVTDKAKYFTPDMSPDGTQLVAVSFSDSLHSELHVLNMDGVVAKKIACRAGELFVHPRFISDRSVVVGLRHANGQMSLQRIIFAGNSFPADRFETLVPAGDATLGFPFVENGKVYFVSSIKGNDDVFVLDLAERQTVKLSQLTSGQTGSYFPSVYNDTLLWSRFTSNGLLLQKKALDDIKPYEIKGSELYQRLIPFRIAMQDSATNVLVDHNRTFPAKEYKKTTGLFNFHSWRPNYTDPEITYSLYSDNYLNTFSNEIYYRYNINETSHGVGFNSFYGGLFPVLSAGVNYTHDRTIKTTSLEYTLDQLEARIGYNIPLNFSGGKTYKFFNAGSNYVYNNLMPTGIYRNVLKGRTAGYLHHFVSFQQQLPRAIQHIYPKFGYTLNLQHRHLLSEDGFQSLGGANFFLPSFGNHSIVLAANLQETDTSNITFSNRFANSRGYNDYYFSRMWRLSGNYHMPLFYPDGGIPGVVYFLRVRTNFFYDFTKVYSRNKQATADQRSVGGEMYFDTKLFNALPATIGFRVSHLLDNDFSGTRPKGTNRFEIIVPLDLIPR